MKRILGLVVALAVVALGTEAVAFTAGNIVILRVGDGTQIMTNVGNSVYLDEYTTNDIWNAATNFTSLTPLGTAIIMPTNWVGGQAPLIMSGVATGEGALSRSTDGRFLVLTGFGATLGQLTNASLASTTTTGVFNQVARVVGLVDGNGNIYTGTTQTNVNEEGEEPRAAVSLDGTNTWLAGDTTGTKYLLGGRASMTSTQVGTSANSRGLGIFSNTLYYSANHVLGAPTNTSAAANLFTGASLPTSFVKSNFLLLAGVYGNSITSSPAQGSPFGFTLLNMNGGSNVDTLYVADNVTNAPGEPSGKAGGVLKYCYIPASNAWVGEGYIYADQAYSVTGVKNGNNASLYITAGGTFTGSTLNRLYPYNDVSGFGGSPQGNPDGGNANGHVIFLTAGSNPTTENTRGIAFAPVGGDPGTLSSASGVISVGPPFGPYFRGAATGPFNTPTNTYTYSVANLGNTTTNYNVVLVGFQGAPFVWIASPTNGTLAPGASTLISITTSNAALTNAASGTPYTGNIVFRTGTITSSASIKATLVVDAFFVTPASNYTAVGSSGGPFTPASQVYTLSNATPSVRGWAITNAVNWYTISATNGSLGSLSTTNVTVTINTNANSLPLGLYSDTLVFNDTNSNSQITSHFVNLQVGFGFFDDFSTNYVDGPIVGQNSWYNPTAGFEDDPYMIVGGVLVMPDVNNNCADPSLQEPAKSISSSVVTDANQFVYLGISMTVTSAYSSPATWDFSMVPFLFGGTVTSNKGRTSVNDVGGGHYAWNTHVNGFDAFIHGTTPRNYNQQYSVFIVGDVGNSNSWVFVNPPSADTNALFAMTADAHDGPLVAGWGGPSSGGIGGIDIDHFCSASTQAGYLINKIAMSTNYADVYNFLAGIVVPPPDPFTVWQNTYFTAGELSNPSFSGPNADPLGKGISNTNQFLSGFNPTNAAAYPHIISIAKSGGSMNVTYLGANGDTAWSPGGWMSRTNVLEFSTGVPGNGAYSNNFASTGVTNILSGGNGTGTNVTAVDAGGATGATRYYRIRVIAP